MSSILSNLKRNIKGKRSSPTSHSPNRHKGFFSRESRSPSRSAAIDVSYGLSDLQKSAISASQNNQDDENAVRQAAQRIYSKFPPNSQVAKLPQASSQAPSGGADRESRSRRARTPTDEKENVPERRAPRSRSAFANLTNGPLLEDSGVDLDSSQGGASFSSDLKLSPNHSRDSSHVSHASNQGQPSGSHQGQVNPAHNRTSLSHPMAFSIAVTNRDSLTNPISTSINVSDILNAVQSQSPPTLQTQRNGGYMKMSSEKRNSTVTVVEMNHIRESSQSSTRSANSSGSSSKSNHSDPRHNRPPSNLSGRLSKNHTPREEVYMKMTDFDNSSQKSKSLEDLYGVRFSMPKLATKAIVKDSKKPNSNFVDHEYVNLTELAMQLKLEATRKSPDLTNEKQPIESTSSNPKVSSEPKLHKGESLRVQAQVHQFPGLYQAKLNIRESQRQQELKYKRQESRQAPYRKPGSEDSDLESTSESVTSQEVAVLTAVSRNRRHKRASHPVAQPGKGFNKSLVSFAEQSILSFLSNMDANTDSESEPGTRFEHATRNFTKGSPTPTNASSSVGGSPLRDATPTNEKQSNPPTLHQIVSSFDLAALTLCKTGYRYPHFGIHVTLRRLGDYGSPVSDISSRNSSKVSISKPGSAFTPLSSLNNTDVMLPAVVAIDQDGVAGHDSRINEGDFIIEVNGVSVLDKTADETEGLINSEEMVHLVITRGRPVPVTRHLRNS